MKKQPESVDALIRNLKTANKIADSNFTIPAYADKSKMVLERMRNEQQLLFCAVMDLFCALCSKNVYATMRNYMFIMSVYKTNPTILLSYCDLLNVAKRDLDGKKYGYHDKVTSLISTLVLSIFGSELLERFSKTHQYVSKFSQSKDFLEPRLIKQKMHKAFLAEGYDGDSSYFKKI